MNFLSTLYPWVKVIHLAGVISWMAGLLYLPRLFVNHVERAKGNLATEKIFQDMERKLYRIIMNPAMMVSWAFGLMMVFIQGENIYASIWFGIKFLCVVLMTVFHLWCKSEMQKLQEGVFSRSGRFYRLMNEIPTLLMLVILVMVVVRPF